MRLAIVISHPVQYYSPWFRCLAEEGSLDLRVFYLWNSGVEKKTDRGFGRTFAWDVPLLDGYDFEFVPNRNPEPGTHHFNGLDNPDLIPSLMRWKPDAILLFGYAWRSHLRVLLSFHLRKVPLLFRGDSHDLCPESGWKSLVKRGFKRCLLRRFDHFLSVGRANRESLLRLGIPETRITVAPHCVDNARFRLGGEDSATRTGDWKASHGIDCGRPVILFVGKFEEKKRPQDLLAAFLAADFAKPGAAPVLVLVGDGVLLKELQEMAADQLGSMVFIVPFQNQSQMPDVYAVGDVLVLPSKGSGETWGLVVNEAMNLGLPVIVSDHVGCGPDLVLPGETGWVFRAGNRDDLKGCLVEAMGDSVKRREMGRNAREHVAKFSYEAATGVLLSVLSQRGRKAGAEAPVQNSDDGA